MLGVLAKTYYARNALLDPSKLFVVSIMPCTAKKFETSRTADMFASGHQDVDVTLTTREFARMLKQSGIDFLALEDGTADSILGRYSGAGTIFGVTGGVMEAALRTAHYYATGQPLQKMEVESVRGLPGVKEGSVQIGDTVVRVAVAHGLANVETVLDRVRTARNAGDDPPYHFIEVMACPGGCIGGGGQPYGVNDERRKQRIAGIYQDDRDAAVRCSYENPEVARLYQDFLGAPLGKRARELLHTRYTARPLYQR
jgi:NADH-quinone oxidoreductase subunit G